MGGYLNMIEVRDASGRTFGNVLTSDRSAAREVFLSACGLWFDEYTSTFGEGQLNGTVPELRVWIR